MKASKNRIVADLSLFENADPANWESCYDRIMEKKYKKNTRRFSYNIYGMPQDDNIAPVYVVPRIRAGPSYLQIPLRGIDLSHVQYCPISKGFSMQDVSSFTMGPIVGEGLCLVNAAFSKCVTVAHIEGGGILDLKRVNFWKRARKPKRNITIIDDESMIVDGVKNNIKVWLKENEQLWLTEWEKWRKSIALCSRGDFHWTDKMGETISYRYKSEYLDFVQWKKQCYIAPSYELLPKTTVFQFLKKVWSEHNIPLGLVHPKALSENGEEPVTREYIRFLFDSPDIMCCQPYVVVGLLFEVPIS